MAGEIPVDLEIKRRNINYALRNGKEYELEGITYQVEIDDKEGRSEARRNVRNVLLDKWQDRWNRSEKGRTLFEYLPDVKKRLEMTWLESNFYITQML